MRSKPWGIAVIWRFTLYIARRWSVKKATHFFLRSLLVIAPTASWLMFVSFYYGQFGIDELPLHIITKLTRTYGSRHLCAGERVSRLKAHYDCMAECFSRDTMQCLLRAEVMTLGAIHGKSGQSYSIHLQQHASFWQEGELTLSLYDDKAEGGLSYLTFSIAKLEDGRPFIWIGGLQGWRLQDAKKHIVKATRDLHGLRPKYAILECLYPFAQLIQAAEVRAVARNNHSAMGSKKKFFADYDSFWEEVGGVLNKNNNFTLPAILPRRTVDEVASHKKKDWLKRQDYIQALQNEVRLALKTLQ